MKKQNKKEQETVTIDEVIESYRLLHLLHKVVCIMTVVLICTMIGFVIWGISFAELRWILISFGIAMGICGAALYTIIHRIYIKTSFAILNYFKTSGMSEQEILEKARELKIPEKMQKTDQKK